MKTIAERKSWRKMTDMAAKCTRGEDISEAAAVSLKGGLAF